MQAQKLSQTFVLALLVSACHTAGTCKTDDDCPQKGSFCFRGDNPKPGADGICSVLMPGGGGLPQPRLKGAQFSSDCSSVILSGEPGIQAPASYASSTGSIDTLCPGGVSGSDTGFSCALSSSPSNPFAPGTHSALWTVRDDRGGESTASAYSFQAVLTDAPQAQLFPMERSMPAAVLGRDAMDGRQPMSSAVGTPHPSGGCWGATARGSIAVGLSSACALEANGKVRCWGPMGTMPPGNLGPVLAITASAMHACALLLDGKVHCWGMMDIFGATNVPGDLGPAVAIYTGSMCTCALQVGGKARCWGMDIPGESALGDLGEVVSMAIGYMHACVLQADGKVHCWGMDTATGVPHDLGEVVAIAAGTSHACALLADGKVRCWGEDNVDQLDPPAGLNAAAIAAGDDHTCALQVNGTVLCWGSNSHNQLEVPITLRAVAIAAGSFHTCALQANGMVSCWGGASSVGIDPIEGMLGAAVQTTGQLVIQQ